MSDTQDRDQQILSRLARIEHRVDSIDQTSAFALRADEKKHLESVQKIFGTSKRRAQVYLAANGHRGVEEIAEHLGMKQPNVSRDLKQLNKQGLLELVDVVDLRSIWAKKALDRTVRISQYLEEHFELGADGRPKKNKKAKQKNKKRRIQ